MTKKVKNNEEVLTMDATKIREGLKASREKLAEEDANALLAEAEAEATLEATLEVSESPDLANLGDDEEPKKVEDEPNEEPKDKESEETPNGDEDGDMSIDYIEERIDELMTIGRANWTKEQRREYRRLDQALDAYENGESVEDVAKADAKASKSMGEDAITEANFKKFDAMKAQLDIDYGEENFFAKSLIRTSNVGIRLEYGGYTFEDGEWKTSPKVSNMVVGDDYDGFRSGNYSFSWDESNTLLTIEYQTRRLLDQVLALDNIRTKVIEDLGIKKGSIEFVVSYNSEADSSEIGNPTYSAKCGKGKGSVLGAKSSNGWLPKGKLILSEDYKHEGPFGTVTIPSGEWSSIASMFDTKRKQDEGFSEENLNRNGGDWGALAKVYSSDAKTYTLHRKGYKNPTGATTGGRVIEGLLEAMPREAGMELANLLKVQNGELSFAEVSPKFRKYCGFDDEAEAEDVNNNDVEGNE